MGAFVIFASNPTTMISPEHNEIFNRAINGAVFAMREKYSVNGKSYVSERFCRDVIQFARDLVQLYDEKGIENTPGNYF